MPPPHWFQPWVWIAQLRAPVVASSPFVGVTRPPLIRLEIARQLYGVVQQENRSGGVIVTTSYFTRGAQEFAESVPYQLFLRDFGDLKKWLQREKKGT